MPEGSSTNPLVPQKNKVALEMKMGEFLAMYERNAQVYTDVGEFLPLSVWESRGFNST